MSPLNRGPLLGPRAPPAGVWPPPPPRFGARLPPPGMPPRMPPPPMSGVFGPMRQRLPPPPRPAGVSRPGGPMPLFPPRGRGISAMAPPMGIRPNGPRGPHMQGWPRRVLPPQMMPHIRPRFAVGNGAIKSKAMANAKKVSKLEELELKKPWMTDEIRSEIQKKNKLYAKAKKNKDAKEWEEFKDLRNKVTRMIRDAKNEYLAKHPEQAPLYQEDDEPYDQRDENYISAEEEEVYYCEVCDKEFQSEESWSEHGKSHQVCGIDGCTFSAHPLLVQKHISMQHSSGLYHKIKNLSTPEDIKKWVAERKTNYPTKANAELRQAKELEKKQRGELIKEVRTSVHSKSKKTPHIRERKRKSRKRHTIADDKVLPRTREIYRGLYPFPGTSCLLAEDETTAEKYSEGKEDKEELCNIDVNISDEEEPCSSFVPINPVIENTVVHTVVHTPVNTPVFSLVANYDSESNEDDCPEEVPIKKIKVDDEQVTDNSQCTSTVERISAESHLNTSKIANPKHERAGRKQIDKYSGKKNPHNSRRENPKRLHLLERLLSRSIQHERNLICQCIKYIVDNNFFD